MLFGELIHDKSVHGVGDALATSANATLACCAETVPERMRVPIRNRLSCPNNRSRSRNSS
jgi:hypothetical protein